MSPSVAVILPCLNEQATIEACVREARQAISHWNGSVIVADNESVDQSSFLAQNAGAKVVRVARKGYGAAVRAGLAQADADILVFADADQSYCLTEIPTLLTPLLEGKADFVIGSRLKGPMEKSAMPYLHRWIGTPVLNILLRVLFGIRVSDCNSGFRAIRKSSFTKLMLHSEGMEFASEILIAAKRAGLRICEVPVRYRKDSRVGPSHLRRWRDGFRHLRVIFGDFLGAK